MNKSPEAFRTISEVAEALDVPPHVLRFWESRFTQVKPVKRGGGRRYYRPEDVRLLRGIRGLLYDDGMTIKGAQKILREKGVRHVIALGTLPEAEEEALQSAPAPAPAAAKKPAKPARAPAKAPARAPAPPKLPSRPQGDLFATGAPAPGGAAVAELEARTRPAEVRDGRKALKALVAELESLRAVMMSEPGS
ncbi:MAG TPA: MerR family transcriptional regulator [Amaricoccus sp.]|uniref:MerR family transcriptional regulator n=1 Tax=Amaricoccus sp. TaxID=1872485 RepID=UPI002CFB4908|nr:MerR family transcriptional regulator [Amaricoccus sp.]HMQ94060.1 MerR family transcriptional regulator [Amaricoccus sp.]HMR53073.1 MerR family transcriptional regulator [Amaricoccus sp.]HMR61071.1 MerR family transcriptional regulator [Amaricoccus sp.]HMT99974.1 MerR family transcriptional regulator [Amaricoccus sp.]